MNSDNERRHAVKVQVNGKWENRLLDYVERDSQGRFVETSILNDGEEMFRATDGTIHVFSDRNPPTKGVEYTSAELNADDDRSYWPSL